MVPERFLVNITGDEDDLLEVYDATRIRLEAFCRNHE